jgi:CubicO group peptidase (beta-lactamase class C family)
MADNCPCAYFVQEGKISLDDKISSYLPLFKKHMKGHITIRHCLTNNTGIQAPSGISKFTSGLSESSLEAEANMYAAKREIETNAGTEFRYSPYGFNIAARVLEVVTKRAFDRIMQDRITRTCGMKNTKFTSEDYNAAINPAAGATSTALDLSNFMSMILNKGMFNGKQVLTPESVELLLTMSAEADQVKGAPKAVEKIPYGHGQWILETSLSGKPVTIGVPSFNGVWPMVDLCRGYTYVMISNNTAEPKREVYMNIKGTIDEMLGGKCQ